MKRNCAEVGGNATTYHGSAHDLGLEERDDRNYAISEPFPAMLRDDLRLASLSEAFRNEEVLQLGILIIKIQLDRHLPLENPKKISGVPKIIII